MPKSDTSQNSTVQQPNGSGHSIRLFIALKLLGLSSKLTRFALWIAPELRGPRP